MLSAWMSFSNGTWKEERNWPLYLFTTPLNHFASQKISRDGIEWLGNDLSVFAKVGKKFMHSVTTSCRSALRTPCNPQHFSVQPTAFNPSTKKEGRRTFRRGDELQTFIPPLSQLWLFLWFATTGLLSTQVRETQKLNLYTLAKIMGCRYPPNIHFVISAQQGQQARCSGPENATSSRPGHGAANINNLYRDQSINWAWKAIFLINKRGGRTSGRIWGGWDWSGWGRRTAVETGPMMIRSIQLDATHLMQHDRPCIWPPRILCCSNGPFSA